MDPFTKEDLQALIGHRADTCVSIYLPTHRVGDATQQDRIRLKNLLRQAEESLIARGMRSVAARELLAAPRALEHDSLFWSGSSDGLAAFIAPGMFHRYRLPCAFEELAHVDGRFFVKPLLRLAHGNGRYYLLAASQNRVRLYEGNRYRLREVEVATLPKNLVEALNYQKIESTLQFHTAQGVRGAKSPVVYHGQGGPDNTAKEDIEQFFRLIDRELHPYLRESRRPLLFAGVGYLFPIYRSVNTYPHLMDETVQGNPDGWNAEELFRRAWTIAAPAVQKDEHDALAQYRRLAGTPRATDEVKAVVLAACQGRVETLLVAAGAQPRGTVDAANSAVESATAQLPGEDLADRAALETLRTGGQVFVLDRATMPGGAELAAVLRY